MQIEPGTLTVATVIQLDAGPAAGHPAADTHYGWHAGLERLLRVLDAAEHPVSWVVGATPLASLPHVQKAVTARGDDWLLGGVAEADPAALRQHSGVTARGWLGHPMQTPERAAQLVAAGYDHVLAPSPLDHPFHLAVPGLAGLVVVPLLADLSDTQLLGARAPEVWLQALIDSTEVLQEEAQELGAPRALALHLHLPVIARPAHIRALQQYLDFLAPLDDVGRVRVAALADAGWAGVSTSRGHRDGP